MSPKQDNQSSAKQPAAPQAAPVTPSAPLPLPAAQSLAEAFEARKAANLAEAAGLWASFSKKEKKAAQLMQRGEARAMIDTDPSDCIRCCEPIAHLFPINSPAELSAAYKALLHYRYSEIGKPIRATKEESASEQGGIKAKISAWRKRTA